MSEQRTTPEVPVWEPFEQPVPERRDGRWVMEFRLSTSKSANQRLLDWARRAEELKWRRRPDIREMDGSTLVALEWLGDMELLAVDQTQEPWVVANALGREGHTVRRVVEREAAREYWGTPSPDIG